MIDRGYAAQLAEDIGLSSLRTVLDMFRTDLDRLVGELGAAAEAGDMGAFRRSAHGLAGAAGAVGAVGLERACRAAMAETDVAPARARQIVADIRSVGVATLQDLDAWVARLDPQD